MKKIIAIMNVKNESDIVESCCRYNLTYCDGMVICDNGSLDNTKDIIQNLIDEGLPIYFEKDLKKKYPELTNKNMLMKEAIDKYDADLIVPLDADEFLYHTDGINPREALEALSEDIEYQAVWRTYIYQNEPDIKLGFMPNNFPYYRNPLLEEIIERNTKAIASKYLIKNKHPRFVEGAHFLIYPEAHQNSVVIKRHEKLVFAHFPVRSQAQSFKRSVNYVGKWGLTDNRLPIDDLCELLNHCQPGFLFNEYKNWGEISPKRIRQLSLEYAIFYKTNNNDMEDFEKIKAELSDSFTINCPMDVSFCADKLHLRYTNYDEDEKALVKIMFTEIVLTVVKLQSTLYEKNICYSNHIHHLNQEIALYKSFLRAFGEK